jgi:hypothetical protein
MQWVKTPLKPSGIYGNEARHQDMGRVQRLGAVGERGAEVAVRLSRPTCRVSRTHLGFAPSSFLQ